MKINKLLPVLAVSFTLQLSIHAQSNSYQLRNGDFEAPFVPAPGASATGTEPPYWHSFGSLTGSMASTARSGAQISQSTDTRNSIGFSCKVNARTILGIATANGNMTTGRVNAGSITASNVANHNFTDPNDNNFNEPWTSTPDSIRFWAKYTPNSATQYARMSAYIHDNYKFTDPLGGDANSPNYIVGSAEFEWQRGDQDWHQYTVPFDYASYAHLGNSPKYILITFTTNKTPGSGNQNDALYIDDIEFIYSAWLTDLKINGTSLNGFEKELLEYAGPSLTGSAPYQFPYDPNIDKFSWESEVSDIIKVTVSNVNGGGGDADGGYTSILVTASDSVDASTVTTKEYRIYYYSDRSADNTIAGGLGYAMHIDSATIPVQGFSPSVLDYFITFTDPEEVRIPVIKEEDIILSDTNAEIYRVVQPTSVNSTGSVTVRAENLSFKSYNLHFSKEVSSNSRLSSIKIGGMDIAGFDPDTLIYYQDVISCVAADNNIPTVTYNSSSPWAEIIYTQATTVTKTATIAVTAEDNTTQTIYTIFFDFKNNNTVLSGYRVASTNRNNSFNSTNNYTDVYAASLSSAPALSISTTSGQQGCAAQRVVFPPAVFFPDTNYIKVTAQDGITTQTYKSVLKNTNCYLKQTTGNNVGLKYRYNGVVRNITVPSSTNNNNVTINVTIPAVGPNVPCELIDADPQAPVVDTIIYTQPTARTGNSGKVQVIANDGTTNKTYIINFTSTVSTDASLKSIAYNADTLRNISPTGQNNHINTIVLPSSTVSAPKITAIPNFEWLPVQNITITQATTLSDTIIIDVTAENGTTKNTYKFAFNLINDNDNAYLKSIKYDSTNMQFFNPDIYNYTINIPYTTAVPPVISAVPMVANASVFYTQPAMPPYQGKVLVVSENWQKMKVYTVNFIPTMSADATLADIKIDSVSLPNFNPQGLTYMAELPYTQLVLPVVTATPTSAYATITSISQTTFNGRVTINVRAESGATNSYTIDISRAKSPIYGIDTIKYQRNNQSYAYKVNHSGTSIIVEMQPETEGDPSISEIILSDSRADYRIYEYPNANNNFTGTVTVFAENGSQITYFIKFEETKSASILLTNIFYDGVPIPNFDPDTLNYTIFLPYNTPQIPIVSAELNWKYTDLVIDQPMEIFGTSQIYVTSEDGLNSITYTVSFEEALSVNAKLDMIKLDGYNLNLFNPNVYQYEEILPRGTTSTPEIEAIAQDTLANVSIAQLDSEIPSTAVITVTAQDRITVETYYIHFKFEPNMNAWLSSIKVDGNSVDNFTPETMRYDVSLPADYFGTPIVTAVAQDTNAAIVMDYFSQVHNEVRIRVTAENQITIRNYTVAFYKNLHVNESTIDEISIYPNPTDGQLRITNYELRDVDYTIYSIMGQTVLQGKLQESAIINVESLASGMYYLKIGNKTVKFVREFSHQ